MLHVDALDRADALGEVEDLRLAERRGGEPAAVLLPHDRRVEALLDRGPHRERRREDSLPSSSVTTRLAPSRVPSSSISLNRWSAAYLANTSESPGSTPIPTSASRPADSHSSATANCSSPSLTPVCLVRRLRVRLRQGHRHVEVVGARRRTRRRRSACRRRGSTAFITWVMPCSRHSAATDSADDASTCAATNRSSVGRGLLRPRPGRSRRPRSSRRSRAGPRWRRTPRRRRRRRPAGSSCVLTRRCRTSRA